MSALYLAQGAELGSPPKFELVSLFQLLLGTAYVEVGAAKYIFCLMSGEVFP